MLGRATTGQPGGCLQPSKFISYGLNSMVVDCNSMVQKVGYLWEEALSRSRDNMGGSRVPSAVVEEAGSDPCHNQEEEVDSFCRSRAVATVAEQAVGCDYQSSRSNTPEVWEPTGVAMGSFGCPQAFEVSEEEGGTRSEGLDCSCRVFQDRSLLVVLLVLYHGSKDRIGRSARNMIGRRVLFPGIVGDLVAQTLLQGRSMNAEH